MCRRRIVDFGGRCTIEEAVIECGHPVSFGELGGLVVLIEEAARVWQAIQRIGDSVFLCGIQSADLGDVGLQSCNDPVCIRWESCIKIGWIDVHSRYVEFLNDGEL